MATPASGAIKLSDMRSEITRGSGAISLSTIRTRLGRSGAIKFSQCYAAEGFVVTTGSLYLGNPINITFYGWDSQLGYGSVSPAEANGRVQFATSSFLSQVSSSSGLTTTTALDFSSSSSTDSNTGYTTGYSPLDVTRIVTANTSRTITSQNVDAINISYDITTPGIPATIHCVVQF